MAGLLRNVAARISRVGAVIPSPRRTGPAPAQVARRRQVSALQRRELTYAPERDGQADPGEIVWTWVPYEDDPRQGKDRPVLVVGRHSRTLFGLMLSSQSERDGQRHWFALGRVSGTATTGRAGSGWTGCSPCARTASAGRVPCWIGPGSTGSGRRCAPATAGADRRRAAPAVGQPYGEATGGQGHSVLGPTAAPFASGGGYGWSARSRARCAVLSARAFVVRPVVSGLGPASR